MFLTAVHCGDALDHYNGNTSGRGLVTFAAEFVPGESETVPGTLVRHPSWTSVSSSNLARNDVAVVLLDRPVDDIVPRPAGPRPRARPRPARADVPHGRLRLRGARHRAGLHRHQPARQADSSFQSLTRDFLRLSQVQAAGDEGVCLGDSGGPQFDASGLQVSVTSTTDGMCTSYSSNQRLDLPEVRDFLDDHVTMR